MIPLFWTMISLTLSFTAFAGTLNLAKDGLALEGYDPVSYFRFEASKQGPLKGDAKYEVKLEDAIYRFTNEANKQEFLKNPGKYRPAYSN